MAGTPAACDDDADEQDECADDHDGPLDGVGHCNGAESADDDVDEDGNRENEERRRVLQPGERFDEPSAADPLCGHGGK